MTTHTGPNTSRLRLVPTPADRTVWIAGAYPRNAGESLFPWEMIGVFDSQEKAVAACTRSTHFIAPLEMNAVAPEATTVWEGAYYPLIEQPA